MESNGQKFEAGDRVIGVCPTVSGLKATVTRTDIPWASKPLMDVRADDGRELSFFQHRFRLLEEEKKQAQHDPSPDNKLHRRAQQAESRVAQLERLIAQVMDEWARCEGQPLVDLYMNSGVSAEACARTAINAILNSNRTLRRERDEACSHGMGMLAAKNVDLQERIKDLEHTVVQMAVAGWAGRGK